MSHSTNNHHLLGNFVLFVTALLIASTMLFVALLLWIAHLLGSLIWALLIMGAAASIVAIIMYYSKVRPEMAQLRSEVATIYEVANIVRSAYRWVTNLFKLQI